MTLGITSILCASMGLLMMTLPAKHPRYKSNSERPGTRDIPEIRGVERSVHKRVSGAFADFSFHGGLSQTYRCENWKDPLAGCAPGRFKPGERCRAAGVLSTVA